MKFTTHKNRAACIAALPARGRRGCAAWYRGSAAAPAIARPAARGRAPVSGRHWCRRAASLPVARLLPAASPQCEGIAIAPLLQRLFDREAPCVFHRAQLRFALLPRLQHGQRYGQVVAGTLVVGTLHDRALPFSRCAFAPKGVIVPKAQLQARLPGTWSERALPAIACPSPASTSRPGHNAGRLMPKPPGRGLQIRPRAPPSLLMARHASGPCP